MSGTGIHLHSATAITLYDPVRVTLCKLEGLVIAATINDDKLVTAAAVRLQLLQVLHEYSCARTRLVQNRHDDRNVHSGQSAAAAATVPGGAAVTMVHHGDCLRVEIRIHQFTQVLSPVADTGIETEHLVEIAIVDITLPVDADKAAAHDGIQIVILVRLFQCLHVALELPSGQQATAETLDRHIRQREQMIENDAVVVEQDFLVIGFEFGL